MKRIRRFSALVVLRFKDLFFGPSNIALDLGRILAGAGAILMIAATVSNIVRGQSIDLGPGGLGGGLGAFFTAAAAFVYVKDKYFKAPEA